MEIEDAIHRKRMGKLFMVKIVPVPPSEQADYGNEAKTIMITRVVRKRRGYIAQRPDSLVDKMGQEILRNQIGLEVEEWRTMWYNKYSYVPPYEAQFLEPGDSDDSHETKGRANGKKVKIVYTVRKRVINKTGEASNGGVAEGKLEA
ncbi:hypothetical protein RSOLAG22IIIB_12251 [Rhizoctonia solani]|uniref:Uncharacterized protein n=1 Tax=Rhizoctonia solani TaxID=456999 RepID=A0A0K6GCS0_9AGAM|nr:hypothetical protein RSOLAG22IIIB_12251 [Rhizoctonia solani]